MAKSPAAAKTPETAPAVIEPKTTALATMPDYGDDAGAGFENTTNADLTLPFLNIMQAISPEVEAKLAETGQIFNTVTGEVIDGDVGVPIIPCHKEIMFVEWVPRNKGGGLVARHLPSSDIVKKAMEQRGATPGKMSLPNGNDLVETHYIYALLLDDTGEATDGFAVISCSSTKITPAKKFTTALYMMKGKPPLFANRAVLKTVKEKNDKGTFANVDFRPLRGSWTDSLISPATDEGRALLAEGRQLREMILSGAAKMGEEGAPAEAPVSDGPQGKANVKDGKAPF